MSESILPRINHSDDVKKLSFEEMRQLAREIRKVITDTVYEVGGHFASNLGTVEMTIALHKVFDFPKDVLIWDVGHQCYPHKLITGRRDQFHTLRQFGGLTGFPNREESPYDPFTTGHAGTSISSAIGMKAGFDTLGKNHKVIAVIGDGAMTEGMAFEAVNHVGDIKKNLIILLNDNKHSISATVGSLSNYLNRIRMQDTYIDIKKHMHNILNAIPGVGGKVDKALSAGVDTVKRALTAIAPGVIFEEVGLNYFGPIDGHDILGMIKTFQDIKDVQGPILLHMITQKGIGHPEAEKDPIGFYARSPKHKGRTPREKTKSWSHVFSETLVDMARAHENIMAVTAAMPEGTGLDKFEKNFPDRYFDVAIAEQHAVGLASGMWAAGAKPFVGMYSTFLQRGYDQIFQEIALQKANVVLAIDRAGFVGDDGPTHHGVFDIAFLRPFPNLTLLAPMDAEEMELIVRWSYTQDDCVAFRYPRGGVPQTRDLPRPPIERGKGVILREGGDCVLLPYGEMVYKALDAADILAGQGLQCMVINPRFAKPLDEDLIGSALRKFPYAFTMENHMLAGGFGSAVLELASTMEENTAKVIRLGIPDQFVEHGSRDILFKRLGLDADNMAARIQKTIQRTRVMSTAG